MKIRIIGAQRPGYWYASSIGAVYEAQLSTQDDIEEWMILEGLETNEYFVPDCGDETPGWVDKRDCVEVE